MIPIEGQVCLIVSKESHEENFGVKIKYKSPQVTEPAELDEQLHKTHTV